MAISTYKTFLMHSADGSAYTKLVDIKSFPDLGQEPELLETTTLSDKMQTFILGILTSGAMNFTANYDVNDFATLKGMEGTETQFAVWFGGTESGGVATPDGSNGKFAFSGELAVYPVGGGVNEVVDMNITIAPSTPITFTSGT